MNQQTEPCRTLHCPCDVDAQFEFCFECRKERRQAWDRYAAAVILTDPWTAGQAAGFASELLLERDALFCRKDETQ